MLKFKTEGEFDLAESIKANNPELKSQKILEYVAFIVLIKESGGKRLRNFLGYTGSPNENRKWYKIKKIIKALRYDKRGNYQALDTVRSGLISFEPTFLQKIISQKSL